MNFAFYWFYFICMKKHASLSNLKNYTNFLYFSFTTSCLEIKLCSIHFIVTTVMLIIVSTTSKKIVCNNFNHTPKQTNLYSSLLFYITFNTFVSSSHISLLDCWCFTLYPSLYSCTLWRINPNCIHEV